MESPLNGPSTRLSKPGSPVRPLKEKELGTVGEMSTSNPRTEVPGTGPEAPNVFARGTDDIDMGDDVAQNVGTARQTEEHVLTGHASFRSWCAACVQGRGRAERHQGEGRKELEDGLKIPVVSWDY